MTAMNTRSPPSLTESGLALFCYCAASLTMTCVNRYVLAEHQLKLVFGLLATQSLICTALLILFKYLNVLTFRTLNKMDASAWFPVTLFLVTMIYTGSKSLQLLTISIFTIFKNITIILIALGDRAMFGKPISFLSWLSFILIVISSILGGFNDIMFDLQGYFWMSFNCLSTAAYVLYMRKQIKSVGFSDFDSVFYNNILSIPVFLILSLLSENWRQFYLDYFDQGPLQSTRSDLFWGIFISSIATFGIGYSTSWAIRVTSSTTYSMTGALNKLPVAVSGMIFLKKDAASVTPGNILSVLVGSDPIISISLYLAFVAGLVYSYAQIRATQKSTKMEPLLPLNENAKPSTE